MAKTAQRALCWLRRDLRLSDHSALAAATAAAESVAVVFIFDRVILDQLQDRDDRRITFIHRSLVEIDEKLQALGSKLVVLVGDPIEQIPLLARHLKVDEVVTATDYEPYAVARDARVQGELSQVGIGFRSVQDTVLVDPAKVVGPNGPYRVYSPFARAWRIQIQPDADCGLRTFDPKALTPVSELAQFSHPWSLEDIGFVEAELSVQAGESGAIAQLEQFWPVVTSYAERRDFPAQPNTSVLSPHLRFGTVSIRELARRAYATSGKGAEKWLAELIWREFYFAIIHHFPYVVDTTFNPAYRDLQYPGGEEEFRAWTNGQTGYPLVDAAMRCLLATGWMHNRLRMVVASFLTKDLLVDYRLGEAHFARYLLDFELASNNGGWQWAAGTGADPQPYFRIFNPILQSEKFDPDGEFIRKWVPELRELSGPALHFPTRASTFDLATSGVELGRNYPFPVVDHYAQRPIAIELLSAAAKAQ